MVDATNGKGGFKEFAQHEKNVVSAPAILSDTTNGKGGFGQFRDRYRDRWATLHPKMASADVTTPVPVGDPLQEAEVDQPEMVDVPSGSAFPKPLRLEPAATVTPFGRRRVRND
jgi:hypothetical protein